DVQYLVGPRLHLWICVDTECPLEPSLRRRDLLHGPRVDDLVRRSPQPGEVTRHGRIGLAAVLRLPALHGLVHAPAVQIGADRTHEVVDELVHFLAGPGPVELSLLVLDVAVEGFHRDVDEPGPHVRSSLASPSADRCWPRRSNTCIHPTRASS